MEKKKNVIMSVLSANTRQGIEKKKKFFCVEGKKAFNFLFG
jgi:hypothetical protein